MGDWGLGLPTRGPGREAHAKSAKDAKKERSFAPLSMVEVVLKLRGLLRMNCHAQRLECVELAPAFEPPTPYDSASPSSVAALRRVDKLDALQTLRAIWLRLCRAASFVSLA